MWLTKMLMLIINMIEMFALILVKENPLSHIDTDGQQLLNLGHKVWPTEMLTLLIHMIKMFLLITL